MADKKITFTAKDTGLAGFDFVLEPAENNGRTIFAPNDRARIKLYPGGQNPQLSVTSGQAKIFLKSLEQIMTEFIVFRDSETAETEYYIQELISAVWQGTGSLKPKIYGSRLVMPEAVTGVLKVNYKTSYDLIDLECSAPTYVLLSAKTSGLTGDTVVDFTDGFLTGIYNKDVVMTVRDACTKETLSDAHVYINGKYTGKSDTEGIIRLGSMKSATYSLKITKDGYQPTDEDTISNDFFTVE